MEYTVSLDGTSLITLHEGTDTTARMQAKETLGAELRGLESEGRLTHWEIGDATVYEPPAAPFDPYTVEVGFGVSVVVEAADARVAEARGSSAIEALLESAALDGLSYASDAAVEAA